MLAAKTQDIETCSTVNHYLKQINMISIDLTSEEDEKFKIEAEDNEDIIAFQVQMKNVFNKIFRTEAEKPPQCKLDLLSEVQKQLDDFLTKFETSESPSIIRFRAIRTFCLTKRVNVMYEMKMYEEGRKMLLVEQANAKELKKYKVYVYSYMELLLGIAKGFFLDGLEAHALVFYQKLEVLYNDYKNEIIPTIFTLIGVDTSTSKIVHWSAEHLLHFSKIGIFSAAVAKNDENVILQYAIPSLLSKIEITIKNRTYDILSLVQDIIDITDIHVRYGFLKQADHLLAVALFNLKNRCKDQDDKHIKSLEYQVILKYAWLGFEILQKSAKVIEMNGRSIFGIKSSKDDMLKIQVYHECWHIEKMIGEGFEKFANVYPETYPDTTSEALIVAYISKNWIIKGLEMAKDMKFDRNPPMCLMEDILTTEKKIRSIFNSELLQNNGN